MVVGNMPNDEPAGRALASSIAIQNQGQPRLLNHQSGSLLTATQGWLIVEFDDARGLAMAPRLAEFPH